MTRSMSGTTGTFSHVYADVVPRPEATAMACIIASGDRSLRTRPSTRCEMNGSIIAISRYEVTKSDARPGPIVGAGGHTTPNCYVSPPPSRPPDRQGLISN